MELKPLKTIMKVVYTSFKIGFNVKKGQLDPFSKKFNIWLSIILIIIVGVLSAGALLIYNSVFTASTVMKQRREIVQLNKDLISKQLTIELDKKDLENCRVNEKAYEIVCGKLKRRQPEEMVNEIVNLKSSK
jgi:Tfp pilus assembly major pilin PilA